MGRVLSCNQHRLSDQKRRLDRLHLRSDNWELRTTNTTDRRKVRTETRRWHWLQLRRSGDGVDAPPRLASLGLLDLTGGERHVWVPDQHNKVKVGNWKKRGMSEYLTLFLSSSSWAQSRRFNITANLLWVLSACSARRIAAFSSLAT